MNKYRKWYNALMARAKTRELEGYGEWHHIKPRALGGSDKKINMVKLTYREHFLAHWLLIKFTKGAQRKSMLYALNWMCHSYEKVENRIIAGWQYEVAHHASRERMLGNKLTLGRKLTVKQKKEIGLRNKGRKRPDVTASKKGIARTPKERAKIRAGMLAAIARKQEEYVS